MGAWKDTAFARRFQLQLPIIQGPFGGGTSTAALVGAVSRAGGLGSFGANALAPAQISTVGRQLRAAAEGRPWALNLWVNTDLPPPPDEAVRRRSAELMAPYYHELGLAVPTEWPERFTPDFAAQVDACLRAEAPVLSFVFGVPSADVIAACGQRGVLTLGTATTVAEARALEAAGVDAIVATGFEAGGHRASFLAPAEACLTGTLSLVPQVVDAVRVPVIAAGGIADGRGVAAALALGAQGVQIGTAFLACEEAAVPKAHRDALFSANATDSVLTRVFSGRLVRALRNRFIAEVEPHVGELAGYPAHTWLTAALRREAALQGRGDILPLQAGQSTALLRHHRAADLMAALVEQTDAVLARLSPVAR